jgi:hypothetical protein
MPLQKNRLHKKFKATWQEIAPYIKFGSLLAMSGFIAWVAGIFSPIVTTFGWPLAIMIGIIIVFALIIMAAQVYKLIVGERESALKDIINHKFINQNVVLDGHHFVNCTFDSCTLEHNGGFFDLNGSNIGEDCRVNFKKRETIAAVSLLYNLLALGAPGKTLLLLDQYGRLQKKPEIITANAPRGHE